MSQYKKDDFSIKYAAISSKEFKEDVTFYYGVKTTGIFCKPGCSSRLPKPQNVVFFNNTMNAVQSGFRPCKRCKPLTEPGNKYSGLITTICRIIEESEEEPTLKQLSNKTEYSETSIQKIFKKITGISPKEYASAIKAQRFKDELHKGSSVTSAIYSAGYGSSSRVYENVKNILAMSPSKYRDSGKGVELRVEVFPCILGFVLIAFTDMGVSTIELGDSEESLMSLFKLKFENGKIKGLTFEDKKMVEIILSKIENPDEIIDIPLDIHGTIFQKKVWNALRNIPFGETRTYSDIAIQIGKPKSVRAVANACGKNEIAILIPCHRVVRKNGELAGYKWGKERKVKLLDNEKNRKI